MNNMNIIQRDLSATPAILALADKLELSQCFGSGIPKEQPKQAHDLRNRKGQFVNTHDWFADLLGKGLEPNRTSL